MLINVSRLIHLSHLHRDVLSQFYKNPLCILFWIRQILCLLVNLLLIPQRAVIFVHVAPPHDCWECIDVNKMTELALLQCSKICGYSMMTMVHGAGGYVSRRQKVPNCLQIMYNVTEPIWCMNKMMKHMILHSLVKGTVSVTKCCGLCRNPLPVQPKQPAPWNVAYQSPPYVFLHWLA